MPYRPAGAAVVTLVSFATFTCPALVSMKPPLPPPGALASSRPPTLTVPAAIPPSRMMTPSRFSTVRDSITPVLFTTLASKAFFAPALMTTEPPSALISPPLPARLASTLWSTCILTRLLPLKVSVAALPAPSATVPSRALMVPWLLTVLASSAT